MPTRPPRPCSRCGEPAVAGGKCAKHKAQQRARSDDTRGTSRQRGYDEHHARTFRTVVLTRDPDCVIPGCLHRSEHADHYPHARRELVDLGLNPNDPRYGRGLCQHHHNQHTADRPEIGRNLQR